MNKIKIPSNIDVEKINQKIDQWYGDAKTKTEIKNLKDCSLLLIHFLIPNGRYIEETKEDGYFKKINSTIFNDHYGKCFSDVKDILYDDEYPIIETDGKNYTDNRSTRYKLRDEFFYNVDTKMVSGIGKYIEKYNSYVTDKKKKNNKFRFLSERLSKRITLDPEVYKYISQLNDEFKSTISTLDSRAYDAEKFKQTQKILNLKFASDIRDIKEGNYNDGTSDTNHRFNSVFSGLKRELRYFIRIDGETVDEIDVGASQPYFLNCTLNSEFYNSKKEGSLFSLFPEFYKEFTTTKNKIKVDVHNFNYTWGKSNIINQTQLQILKANSTNNKSCSKGSSSNSSSNSIKSNNILNNINSRGNSTYNNSSIKSNSILNNINSRGDNTDNNFNSIKSNIILNNRYININKIKYYINNNIRRITVTGVPPVPYMCGKIEEMSDIREFRSILYSCDFYEFILQDVKFIMEKTNYQKKETLERKLSRIDRKRVKGGMMYFLNDKDNRHYNPFVKSMKTAFPNINTIVEFFQNLNFSNAELNKKFENPYSLLLQRLEAYYFLQLGVKSFCDKFPKESVITIHDSVIVKKKFSEKLEECLRTSIEKETGIPMGLSTKSKNPFLTIKDLVGEYLEDCRIAKQSKVAL
ncbi:hypothetical protein [Chryseobacterium sp. HSC-36S06]|uniref:hypothetical protein n=1 Tax=Chryseobacterium sp. HSC-36S06 TaxID=2910970 RepID=UPI00209FDB2A|nr:hypothetical protein [Chryseobacterium sp. HSC-36S06]MCP2037321.1 hypothetical protein [Chryseobacterium sp. HSC-36S06]